LKYKLNKKRNILNIFKMLNILYNKIKFLKYFKITIILMIN